MLNRYFELLPFLDSDNEEIVDLLPSPESKRRLRDLYGEIKDVESVSKALQGSDISLLGVHVWFDGLIAAKPSYARFLAPRAEIVHSPNFEAGCVRVLQGQCERLTRAEKAALEVFLVEPTNEDDNEGEEEDDSESFVDRMQKRRRLEGRQPTYKLLKAIPPTSNEVERVFSVARTTYRQQRHSLQPYTLEMLLVLRENADYWNARTVESAE